MKAPFLTKPEAWLRAQRTQVDPVRQACAVEVPKPRSSPVAGQIGTVLFCCGVGVTFTLLLVHELAGSVA